MHQRQYEERKNPMRFHRQHHPMHEARMRGFGFPPVPPGPHGHGHEHGHGGPWGGRGRGRGRGRRPNVRGAVLALLTERPMHGYEMIQEIDSRTGGAWRPSPGSIYPTLQLLEDEGVIVASTRSPAAGGSGSRSPRPVRRRPPRPRRPRRGRTSPRAR